MRIYQPNLPNTMEPYQGDEPWGMTAPSIGPEYTKVQSDSLEPRMQLGEKSIQGIEIESQTVLMPQKKWYQSPLYIAGLAIAAFYLAKKTKFIK